MDDELELHYQAEEKRRLRSFVLQCGIVCHCFPQYRLDEVKQMPLTEFNELYILAERIKAMEIADLSLAVANVLDKKAGKYFKKRDRQSIKLAGQLDVSDLQE